VKTHCTIIRRALLFCLVAVSPLVAKEPKAKQKLSGEDVKKELVAAPTPPYPLEARRLRMAGKGLFWVHFDKTSGQVDAVKIVQSTGHAELDNSAVSTFYHWRCRPGALKEATIPIGFSIPYGH
jgi:TonB family protein